MKKYDLMHQINARGTFLCTKLCLPYLRKSSNPHVLTLGPPITAIQQPMWFAPHAAYTAAKYGMSIYTMAHAAEFKEEGIAVNCLWPLTTIGQIHSYISMRAWDFIKTVLFISFVLLLDSLWSLFHLLSNCRCSEFVGRF